MSFSASAAASAVADAVFTKSLTQMIKGIRGSKDKNQHEFIAQCLAEIKKELTSTDYDYKTEALKKLIFLQMMGYDMSWAAFHIIEVMSSQWFGHRRVGYLAASLAFNQTTDLILLTTNLLQKAFQQQSIGPIAVSNPKLAEGIQYEIGSAISCFSSIVTPALANDLLQDVMNLLNNTRPYIRKRGILALYSIFHKHPPALRIAFDALLDKLGDENPSVNSSVVYVLCELIAKTPKNYLDLAPQFFHILTSSSNNWVLIKVVKIMGYLVPFEPRLAKKLQEPLSSIITTTPAKSLMYECINTLLCGQIGSRTVVRLCLDKLRELVESSDQNLKYLGLLGLHKLINSFPRIVVQHKDLILDCLNDHDITIRTRALDLVTHLVTPNNLPGVVRKLLQHINAISIPQQSSLASPTSSSANQGSSVKIDVQLHSNQYHNVVIQKILELSSQDQYSMIADFEWFFYTLLDFTRIKGVSYENVLFIQHIIKDLLLSIPDLRPFAINQLCTFILGQTIPSSTRQSKNNPQQQQSSVDNNNNNNNNNTISSCHLLQDIYQYTLLHELQLTETIGHYTTMQNTQSKLKKQALQQLHNQKQHQYKQIASTYMQFNPMVELLSTLSWCIGEYVVYAHSHQQLLKCLLLHPCIPYLSSTTQSSFLFAAMKVYYNTYQQPWFSTRSEAIEYEQNQTKLFHQAMIQAKSLRQNSILPRDFNIDDAENYEQKLNQSDNEDEDEDDDEDDEDQINIKGGFVSLSILGHNIAVGRTFAQHVEFLEVVSSIVLNGLNMFIYHTPYPEVQDRAHVLFHYSLWFFTQLGPEFNSGSALPNASSTSSPPQTNPTSSSSPSIKPANTPPVTTTPTKANNNNNTDKSGDSLVDLTSLIFKEQQQNSALDALIGDTTPQEQPQAIAAEVDFDPLSINITTDTTNNDKSSTPNNNNDINLLQSDTTIVNERSFTPEFVDKIKTYIKYLAPLFSEEMVPISSKTQRKVPVPAGLDLEECIYDLDEDKDKPLYDEKTHPLFPIGQHLITDNYISSKDLDKRDFNTNNSANSMGSGPVNKNNATSSSSTTTKKNDGFSFSSADFANQSGSGGDNNNDGDDNDDDDIFATRGQINKKKTGKSSNAAIDAKHKNDPFYIGSGKAQITKKKTIVNSALTLDDLDSEIGTGVGGKKKMTIKKQQTKALVDDGDDDNDDLLGLGSGKKATKGKKTVAPVDPLDDLLEEKPKKKITKKKVNDGDDVATSSQDKPKKKVTKKKSTTANDDVTEQQQQQQQQQQPIQTGPLAPFQPTPGTITIYQSDDVSIYARARPFLQNVDLDQESVTAPIILVAVTIVLNPNSTTPLTVPMLQLSIHGNKATTVLPSPVTQPTTLVQSVLGANNANIIHLQAKNITQNVSPTCYFAIQWNSPNVPTSSRYFDFDLKLKLNNDLIQYINPVTNHNQLLLPTSIFIQPAKITMSDVSTILTASNNTCTHTETYMTTCSQQSEIMTILKGVEIALNVSLVEAANKTAVYYGQCITLPPEHGNHIFTYIKYTSGQNDGDNRVHITIKTSSQILSNKLMQDCIQLLQLEQDDDDADDDDNNNTHDDNE